MWLWLCCNSLWTVACCEVLLEWNKEDISPSSSALLVPLTWCIISGFVSLWTICLRHQWQLLVAVSLPYKSTQWFCFQCCHWMTVQVQKITSTKDGMFSPLHIKTADRIFMKILLEMYLWIGKSLLNFGRHLNLDPDLQSFIKMNFYHCRIWEI